MCCLVKQGSGFNLVHFANCCSQTLRRELGQMTRRGHCIWYSKAMPIACTVLPRPISSASRMRPCLAIPKRIPAFWYSMSCSELGSEKNAGTFSSSGTFLSSVRHCSHAGSCRCSDGTPMPQVNRKVANASNISRWIRNYCRFLPQKNGTSIFRHGTFRPSQKLRDFGSIQAECTRPWMQSEGNCTTLPLSISEQNRTQGKRIKIGGREWSNKASASSIHGNYWSDRTQLRTTIKSESRMMSGWALAGKNRTRDIVLLLNAWILVFSTWSLVFHSVSSPFRTGRTDRQTIHRTIYTLHSELTAKRHTELYTYYIANWPPNDTQIFFTYYTDPNFSGIRDAKKIILGLDLDDMNKNDQTKSRDRMVNFKLRPVVGRGDPCHNVRSRLVSSSGPAARRTKTA